MTAAPLHRPQESTLSTADPTETSTTMRAVLWDMDGTLVDTEPYWIAAEFALADRYGGTWSQEHALNLVGNDLLASGRYIREHMGIPLEPAEIVEALLDSVIAQVEESVPWRPGARELLADLGRAGVPCALVTMSYRRLVEPLLASLPAGTFAAVVTGDVVTRGKPDPEPYLKAAAELGLAAGDCLAIEDSNTGARSAESAGCVVLCVPNHVPILAGERRVFADTLAGLDAEALSARYAG
ncbi:HAD family hydrolase [Nocardioides houyundeii]|uniref:HAD family hydrolase n=1 Tax=Nocardioides houyundeii TaxID=2045452 RepID=UPI001F0830C4|nr:HAD family phosphatase [Nocardioides houyundeii]